MITHETTTLEDLNQLVEESFSLLENSGFIPKNMPRRFLHTSKILDMFESISQEVDAALERADAFMVNLQGTLLKEAKEHKESLEEIRYLCMVIEDKARRRLEQEKTYLN